MAKTEISTAGYLNLRNYIESSDGWNFVELRDSDGLVWERLDIDNDGRCQWDHSPDANPIVLEITLSGDDEDMDLPEEFAEVAFYAAAEGGTALADGTITTTTLEQASDQLVIRAEIEVPEIM